MARPPRRPWNDDKFDESGQVARVAPPGQQRHVIGADEIKQLRARKAADAVADGVNRVGNAAAFDFLFVDRAAGPARQRQPQQAQSLFRRGRRQVRFEGRLRGGIKNSRDNCNSSRAA